MPVASRRFAGVGYRPGGQSGFRFGGWESRSTEPVQSFDPDVHWPAEGAGNSLGSKIDPNRDGDRWSCVDSIGWIDHDHRPGLASDDAIGWIPKNRSSEKSSRAKPAKAARG